jgi:hypothetical protein
MNRKLITAAIAVLATLAVSACGGSGGSATSAATGYYTALANGNYGSACNALAPGMANTIVTAVINAQPQDNDLLQAAAAAVVQRGQPSVTRCAALLAAIVKASQLQTGELRFAKTATQAQGKTAYVKATGLPDTSSLVVDIVPSLLTLSDRSGSWRITQLG